MKRSIKLIGITFLSVFLTILPFLSMAQEGREMEKRREMKREHAERQDERIPDLTDKQKEDIKAIRLSNAKDVKSKRNLLNEKQARLQTLRTADKADMNEINKIIDEMTALKGEIAKRDEKTIQDIRSLLTEDQKIHFDMHMQKQRRHKERHRAHH